MDLRLDHSGGLAPYVPVLMLLDRTADVHMARRSGANGWIIKPLDALRLRRAVSTVVSGGNYTEPLPPVDFPVAQVDSVDESSPESADSLAN